MHNTACQKDRYTIRGTLCVVGLWKQFKERHSQGKEAVACLLMAEGGSETLVGEAVE